MADSWIDHDRHDRFRHQLDDALRRLDADRHDIVGRAALGEALAELTSAGQLPEDEAETLRDQRLASPPADLPLVTARLTVRPIVADDAAALAAWYGDDETSRYLLQPAMSPAQVEAMVARRAASGHPTRAGSALQLVAEREGEVIGDFFLQLLDPGLVTAEVGWVFSPSVAGQGYATEALQATLGLAFDHFRLHRVVANLDARNGASARLCERLGMRREVHRLADYWSRGEFTDSFEYAVLARERPTASHGR